MVASDIVYTWTSSVIYFLIYSSFISSPKTFTSEEIEWPYMSNVNHPSHDEAETN